MRGVERIGRDVKTPAGGHARRRGRHRTGNHGENTAASCRAAQRMHAGCRRRCRRDAPWRRRRSADGRTWFAPSTIRARRQTIRAASTSFRWAPRCKRAAGRAERDCRRRRVSICRRSLRAGESGKVHGIVTAPLNKAAMHEGGHKWPGHTELLAHQFGVKNFSLVLSAGDLYFFHLTTHVSLRTRLRTSRPSAPMRCSILPAPSPARWDGRTSRSGSRG